MDEMEWMGVFETKKAEAQTLSIIGKPFVRISFLRVY